MSLEETIKDIVIKKVYTIGPKSQVKAAAALMVKKDVGSLIVLRNQRVTGVISERDVLRNIIAVGKDPEKSSLRTLLRRPSSQQQSTRPSETLPRR